MSEIKKLDSLTASKIAAGEVVDKPVNVVKELIENALDAGAAKITVEISGGGAEYIRVTDNGRGIKSDDLPLTVERFATSKISSAEEVYSVNTFGFRGEALAAISSVSCFSIKSIREGDKPLELSARYGGHPEIRPSPISKGTQVTVSKLFENLPVRKKFLKSPRGNDAEMLRFIKHLSAVNAGIEIIVISDGNEVFRSYPSDTITDLAKSVFNEDQVRLGEARNGSLEIRVCATHPSIQRRRRDSIFIGVNGRVIRDQSLIQAVAQAYHRVMPPNTYPAAVVDIRMDPAELDVNIHPAKLEVRFESPSHLFTYVQNAAQAALAGFTPAVYAKPENISSDMQTEAREKTATPLFKTNFIPGALAFPIQDSFAHQNRSIYEETPDSSSAATPVKNSGAFMPELENAANLGDTTHEFNVIGQLADMYILCGTPGGDLMIIDQHIAHERALYEKYRALASEALPSLTLFEPVVVKFDNEELDFLPSIADDLASFGYNFELFGGGEVKITRAPVDVLKRDIGGEFSEIVHDAMNLRKSALRDRTTLVMSCRNAVKAGDKLDIDTMRHLTDALFKTKNPHTCPHGRPIIYLLPAADLAKKFHR
ncbi:MAG: DNA mismatch repair endonuclease MutL [Deferribacteraceae bacterium]|jgi:DNA mismatch repair protein MutL|nr:DNA mismatch repair endonuclease MutL [Deferribacteraceae bacterium]